MRCRFGSSWGQLGRRRQGAVDYFAKDAIACSLSGRSQRRTNVVNDRGKLPSASCPSGIFYPGVVNVIGPGTVVNLDRSATIRYLAGKGADRSENLKISIARASVFRSTSCRICTKSNGSARTSSARPCRGSRRCTAIAT